MKYSILQVLNKKLYFTIQDIVDVLNIKPASARVLCSRYVSNGIFIRLKNNFYVTRQKWELYSRDDFFKIANFLQVPSYISFMTALSFYEVSTQVQKKYFECAALKRSINYEYDDAFFNFYKLKKDLYFDFIKNADIFIATKEKAFLDSVYLYSFGKYKFDISSIDLNKLDKKKIKKMMKKYPLKTRKVIKKLCRI